MQVGRQLPGDGRGASFKGYSSTAACLRHLVRTEGLRGLTRGVGATMLRETPGNAIFFLRRGALSAYGAWLGPTAPLEQSFLTHSTAGSAVHVCVP